MRKSPAGIFNAVLFFLGVSSSLQAAQGDSIQDNHYQVDLTRTVVTGSTRKIGMGGAMVGLAEGNAAIQDNPAAVAYRPRAFMRPWEFDMVLGTLTTTDDDTDNSGSTSLVYSDHVLADVGLMGQYENYGLGGVAQISAYRIERPSARPGRATGQRRYRDRLFLFRSSTGGWFFRASNRGARAHGRQL